MSMRRPIRTILLLFCALFLLPLAVHAAVYLSNDRDADWSSIGMLPAASADPGARLIVFTGRTRNWALVSVHSWVVFKPEGAANWSRYDVVGWGQPPRDHGRVPDGRWSGAIPRVTVDVRGAEASRLIPRIKEVIAAYGDGSHYCGWPGPNSNTFIANVLRAMPELQATLPPNAIGRDYRPYPYLGPTDSGAGIEASLWGLLGLKLSWIEGVELNVLGFVIGLDLRHPGVKLPGFGRIGINDGSAIAATASPASHIRTEQGKRPGAALRPAGQETTARRPEPGAEY